MSESRQASFPGHDGSTLAARVHTPATEPVAWALFAHCFTCSKDIAAAVRISDALAGRGIATLRFDFTGLGESEGDFADTTFSSNVDDLVAAADFMREHHGAPRILVGHSLGGAAVLQAASRIDECVAVATIGAPAEAAHVRNLIDREAPDLAARGVCEVSIGGRPFTVKNAFLSDLEAWRGKEGIEKLGRALLVFHSPQDDIVSVDDARAIFVAARHPKSFVSLDGADHLLKRAADARYVGEVLASWASRYLPEAQIPSTKTKHTADEPGVAVVRGAESGFANEIRVSGHSLHADEPLDVPGGTDTGPSPYDLLLAALGACKSMTMRMYADRKGYPLTGTTVRLRHEKIHAVDCANCATDKGMIDDIRVAIELDGPLDDEQRAAIVAISSRCPVHRTLTSEVRIRLEDES